MGSPRAIKRRNAPVMSLAAAVGVALGTASCGGPAPPTYNDRSAEAPATAEAEPAEANPPQPVEPLPVEREIPLDRLLEIPEGAVAEETHDESIGLRVIVPFHAKGKADSR